MLPSIEKVVPSDRWHRSSRRLSNVKLPLLRHQHPSPPPPDPFPTSNNVPYTIPTLCIDNQYFEGYCANGEKRESEETQTEMERMSTAFRSFAKIHGRLHRQRQNYFEKRGLEDAIQHNIDQQNARIGQTIECLTVCEDITKKYNCSLNNSFQFLIDEFAAKAFGLTSFRAQHHMTHHVTAETHSSNKTRHKIETDRCALIEWRCARETHRIQCLNRKIEQIFEKREK